MKAITTHAYGSPEVLHVSDVPLPQINDNEVLVRVLYRAVTSADARIRGAHFPKGFGFFARLIFGITKPRNRILGSTFSGVVEMVGKNVSEFSAGDEVCGMTGIKMGTYAEYVKIKEGGSIAKKPKGVSHEEAAGVLFGGTAALYFVRDLLKLKNGEAVLINGASGAVGTHAVQIAKHFGGVITGVCGTENVSIVKGLGAENIVDYKKQPIDSSGKSYDVVLDTVGNITPKLARTLLTDKGRAGLMVADLWHTLSARGNIKTGTATEKKQDIEYLLELVEKGNIRVVVDTVYRLEDAVEAHRHIESGQKHGTTLLKT